MNRKCRYCSTEHSPHEPCPPHEVARAAGAADRAAGLPPQHERFPPGTYGHGDYVLGYWQSPR